MVLFRFKTSEETLLHQEEIEATIIVQKQAALVRPLRYLNKDETADETAGGIIGAKVRGHRGFMLSVFASPEF